MSRTEIYDEIRITTNKINKIDNNIKSLSNSRESLNGYLKGLEKALSLTESTEEDGVSFGVELVVDKESDTE